MNIWLWIIISILAGLLTGACCTLWINYKVDKDIEEEVRHIVYLRECGYSPNECRDSHLPGDCPLCGAE